MHHGCRPHDDCTRDCNREGMLRGTASDPEREELVDTRDTGTGGQQARLLQQSVLAGLPGSLMRRLQSVLNSAARLVYSARRSERVTPLLRELCQI